MLPAEQAHDAGTRLDQQSPRTPSPGRAGRARARGRPSRPSATRRSARPGHRAPRRPSRASQSRPAGRAVVVPGRARRRRPGRDARDGSSPGELRQHVAAEDLEPLGLVAPDVVQVDLGDAEVEEPLDLGAVRSGSDEMTIRPSKSSGRTSAAICAKSYGDRTSCLANFMPPLGHSVIALASASSSVGAQDRCSCSSFGIVVGVLARGAARPRRTSRARRRPSRSSRPA